MVKVVGFTSRVNGYRTSKGKMNNQIFIDACKRASSILDKPLNELYTKRQSTKFHRGTGIVWQTITKEI